MVQKAEFKRRLSGVGLFCSAAIWGSTFFIVKNALDDIDPIILVGYRFMLAAIVLFCFCILTGRPLFKNSKRGLVLGMFLWLLYVSQTFGLGITTASNSGFITGLFVAFVPIFSFVISRELPVLTELIATVMSLSGLWILTGGLSDINAGDLMTLVAAVTYAIHIVFVDRYAKGGDDPFVLSFQQFFVVGTASLIVGAVLNLPFSIRGAETIYVVLFLALFPTLSAFVIQVVAQKYTAPLKTSMIFAFEPVFAALFAWTLGQEPVILHRAAGGFLIFLAIFTSGIQSRRS